MTPLCTLLKSGSDVLVQTFTVLVYRPLFLGYACLTSIADGDGDDNDGDDDDDDDDDDDNDNFRDNNDCNEKFILM
ncbi:hypothetical protein ANN_03434 [Periplaneta americana]|uniref:Uncharacterized protein n=1 Tax=Periplaneta americana TaxID=6978 RepID=A0ABQ8U4I6_PERAM|nr:hypothetical protein ANN_03434 [Periplaneta americana]